MARPSDNIITQDVGMTLDRYQELLNLPIAAFNGLNWPEERPKYECNTIWKQRNRDELAYWLAAAEERREQELGYHLAPKWLLDEEHDYACTILLDRKHLVTVGLPVVDDIALSEPITLSSGGNPIDPVELSIDAGFEVSADEVIVTYAGEDVKFKPSSVTVSGTIITIKIPRSRLVKPELNDNREDTLYYEDDANFVTEVDIKRSYSVLDGAINFVWSSAQALLGCDGCSEVTQTACYTSRGHRAKRISKLQLWPASYTDDVPAAAPYKYYTNPWSVRVSYLSGIQNSVNTEMLTLRLSHTMMPNAPCSCPYVEQFWQRDREESEYQSGYGSSKGAVDCWTADFRSRIGSGGMFK